MTESGYYPSGAEFDSDAPYNQVDNPEKEIEVTVSITLSKTIKVKVSDYTIKDSGLDEDGLYYEDIDYSECDLRNAVKSQYLLPNEAYISVASYAKAAGYDKCTDTEKLKGWVVDDFEVVFEDEA